MTAVIFTGSPGGTQGVSGGRGHFILAALTLQAMLGALDVTPSCSEPLRPFLQPSNPHMEAHGLQRSLLQMEPWL